MRITTSVYQHAEPARKLLLQEHRILQEVSPPLTQKHVLEMFWRCIVF